MLVFVYPEVFTLLFLKLAQLTYANGGILTLLMYCKQKSSPLTHRSTVINKTLVHCHRLVLQKHSHMQMCLVYQQHEHYKAHTDTHHKHVPHALYMGRIGKALLLISCCAYCEKVHAHYINTVW